jgi:hypothetical protein
VHLAVVVPQHVGDAVCLDGVVALEVQQRRAVCDARRILRTAASCQHRAITRLQVHCKAASACFVADPVPTCFETVCFRTVW